jgi:glycosyltransferase involved in cell wall biosynthesis
LVLPSLYECGGAVVLEAMAMAKPVIATAWGGPLDYLDASCGILIEPDGREQIIAGFAAAMLRLAQSPELTSRMGAAGRQRLLERFAWRRKIDALCGIYCSLQRLPAREDGP